MPGRQDGQRNVVSFASEEPFRLSPVLGTHRFFPLSRGGSIDITNWTHQPKTGIGYGVSVSRDHPARPWIDPVGACAPHTGCKRAERLKRTAVIGRCRLGGPDAEAPAWGFRSPPKGRIPRDLYHACMSGDGEGILPGKPGNHRRISRGEVMLGNRGLGDNVEMECLQEDGADAHAIREPARL